MWKISFLQLLVAFGADIVLGHPRGWPHVARLTERLSRFWGWLLTGCRLRSTVGGALLWFAVCGMMLGGYFAVHRYAAGWGLAWLLEVVVIYQAIAARDLERHVNGILMPLLACDFAEARRRLSLIVGRDTGTLDEPGICRASIEVVAESLCDGVVAPLFWAALLGAPGALLYRTVNTLGARLGHRDFRRERFGKWAACAADAMSWVPARLTAALLCGGHAWLNIRREARRHTCPNTGWPEAAMARVLGVRLGGGNSYAGKRVEGPLFLPEGRAPAPGDVGRSLQMMWQTAAIAFALLALLAQLRVHGI